MPGAVRTEIQLSGAETGGAFCLLIDETPAGWSLPPHRHRHESETIHVLNGRFEVELAGARHEVGAGQSIHIPAGTVHSGGGSGRRVVIFSPAGLEEFFRQVGKASPGEPHELREALELAAKHGWEFEAASSVGHTR